MQKIVHITSIELDKFLLTKNTCVTSTSSRYILFKIFFFLMWTLFKVCYHIASVYVLRFLGHEASGILAPWPGIEPVPPVLEGEVLIIGPPGKPQDTKLLWASEKPFPLPFWIYLYEGTASLGDIDVCLQMGRLAEPPTDLLVLKFLWSYLLQPF